MNPLSFFSSSDRMSHPVTDWHMDVLERDVSQKGYDCTNLTSMFIFNACLNDFSCHPFSCSCITVTPHICSGPLLRAPVFLRNQPVFLHCVEFRRFAVCPLVFDNLIEPIWFNLLRYTVPLVGCFSLTLGVFWSLPDSSHNYDKVYIV